MSKSALLSSSLAKKYWMALTGLFLCTFLIGHLIGNLQLIFVTGDDGRRAFNEYAYFMQHNIFIKVLSYVTYLSILVHAIVGLYLAVQNKKARPTNYAYNRPQTNSSSASRNMAVLGTIILVFIVTHMVNFWAKMHFTEMPLYTVQKTLSQQVPDQQTGQMVTNSLDVQYVLATDGQYKEFSYVDPNSNEKVDILDVKHGTMLYKKENEGGLKVGEGYKDLHSSVFAFFGRETPTYPVNEYALYGTILYVISMFVLMFHLWHGFVSAFQSLGLRHKSYSPLIGFIGKAFAVVVPLLFAIIPVAIYLKLV